MISAFYNGLYNSVAKSTLKTIAATAPIRDRELILFPLNQPTRITNNANGGNTLSKDTITFISSFLFFVINFELKCLYRNITKNLQLFQDISFAIEGGKVQHQGRIKNIFSKSLVKMIKAEHL